MAFTYSKLAEVTVGSGGAATIDFTNVPQNYNDLKIVLSTRISAASVQTVTAMIVNGLYTGYADKYIYGGGSAGNGSGSFGTGSAFIGDTPAGNATASTFGNQEIYISNYTSSVAKSWSVDSVAETNASTAYMELTAGYNSTVTAISKISFVPVSGNFVQHSTATLYGVKAEV